MRVSVIIPCHNAGQWIIPCLQSIVDQKKPAHEIIVIDDASTDDSVDKIKSSGVPVKLLHVNVRNAGAARNAGIEAATGDWIAFLDADDVWYSHHLSRAAELLERGTDVAFIAYHHFLHTDGTLTPIPESLRPKFNRTQTGVPHLGFPDIAVQGFHFGHSTVLMRLDRLREVGMFDVSQRRRHDMDLWLRMIRDRTWTYDMQPHAQYRVDTPGSISRSVVNCEYYFLRALLKNREGYRTPAMDLLITTCARRAMSLSFVDGTEEDYRLAKELAWPYLTRGFRFFYRLSTLWPSLFRAGIRGKRRTNWRRLILTEG